MDIPERRMNAIANLEKLIIGKGYTIIPMKIENIPTYYVIDELEDEIGH